MIFLFTMNNICLGENQMNGRLYNNVVILCTYVVRAIFRSTSDAFECFQMFTLSVRRLLQKALYFMYEHTKKKNNNNIIVLYCLIDRAYTSPSNGLRALTFNQVSESRNTYR